MNDSKFFDFLKAFVENTEELIVKEVFEGDVSNAILTQSNINKLVNSVEDENIKELSTQILEKYNSLNKVCYETNVQVNLRDILNKYRYNQQSLLTEYIDKDEIEEHLSQYNYLLRIIGGEYWNHIYNPERSNLNMFSDEKSFGNLLRKVDKNNFKVLMNQYIEKILKYEDKRGSLDPFFECIQEASISATFS